MFNPVILISYDEIFVHWKLLSHISNFKRVNMDEMLNIDDELSGLWKLGTKEYFFQRIQQTKQGSGSQLIY
jgi:hypothetical protein